MEQLETCQLKIKYLKTKKTPHINKPLTSTKIFQEVYETWASIEKLLFLGCAFSLQRLTIYGLPASGIAQPTEQILCVV